MRNVTIKPVVFVPLLILAIGFAISGIGAKLFFVSKDNQFDYKFQSSTNQITDLIENRMTQYTNVLYGAQGLFAASNSVEADEWKRYVTTLNLPVHYPGLTSMLFIERVPKDKVQDYQFPIHPFQDKAEYFPITYVDSPLSTTTTSTTTLGFDVSSEPGRHSALLAASSTGQPSATPVVLSASANPLPIFSIYLPAYIKRDATTTVPATGYVAASFRIKDLFAGLASDPVFDKDIDVTITDPDGTRLLDTAASRSVRGTDSNLVLDTTITVGGRDWNVHYVALTTYSIGSVEDVLPWIVLFGGLFLSFLLALIALLYLLSHERALESRSLQLDTLIRNFPYGVVVEDQARKVLYANQRVIGFFSGAPGIGSNILGKNMAALEAASATLFKEPEVVQKATNDIVSKPTMVVNEKIAITDGRFIARDYVPLFSNGERFGTIWIYKDITEEENIDRMKTEFVSLASHQLRTPLTSIKWYAELLEDDAKSLSPENAEYAKEIAEAGRRMNDLVSALLDISRLDLGTFIIEPTPEDLVAIMQSAVDEQLPTIEKKNQKFDFMHPDGLPPVPVDKKLAFIIVQNLISNAMKYSSEGAAIHLTLQKHSDGSYVISCADTGYGIPKKDQPNIFKKLFRADNIRTLDVEGTGLGLYMIKTIAEAADCTITFTSEEGKGSTFMFTIPATGMKPKAGTRTLGE